MSYFGSTNDDHENATVELAERITKLTEQLEMKGNEVKKLETNMKEVTSARFTLFYVHTGFVSLIF